MVLGWRSRSAVVIGTSMPLRSTILSQVSAMRQMGNDPSNLRWLIEE